MELPSIFTKDQIRNIIAQKDWYGLNPETGAFDWEKSVANLAASFNIPPKILRPMIEDQFTPDCLITTLVQDEKGNTIKKPLVEVLLEQGINLHIWTVGDQDWQKTKFKKLGLEGKILPQNYHCTCANKDQALRSLIEQMNREGKTHFLVVDDKETNIQQIKKIAEELRSRGIGVLDYHFKKNDPQADGTAFLVWLKQILSSFPDLVVFFGL